MSSSVGLWLSSIRSVSPRVPTVEYARSERSSAKSSQAARNSALSVARSSAERRRQAGSSLKKVNLTNVRSATRRRVVAAALAAGALMCAWAAPAVAAQQASVTLVLLPQVNAASKLAQIHRISLGLLSTGIDEVSREQTSLDISQGSRIDDRLYGRDLPQLSPRPTDQVAGWSQVVSRARSAPADLIPGLLATTLERAGVPVQADSVPTEAVPPATNVAGHVSRVGRVSRIGHVIPGHGHACYPRACRGFTVTAAVAEALPSLIWGLRGRDLIIALPVPADRGKPILIGIAGQGYRGGDLTSSSTRTDGYVLSTDLAPTILHRFGLSTPDQMDGEPIDAVGHRDPEALDDLADRMEAIPDRRAPVVILSLVGWIVVAGLVGLFLPGLRRRALTWLALASAYMPLMLLAGAAIEPGAVAEGLVVGLGAAVLAGVTLLGVRGWWALAVACAITVVAYAIDMVTGSELTKLSLLGPNPIFGVRFYGIGNELEALIAVMVPVGVGAGLSAYTGCGRKVSRSGAVATFLVAALIGALVFGAGRFGADVGAAIVLPVGASVAIASLPRGFEAFA